MYFSPKTKVNNFVQWCPSYVAYASLLLYLLATHSQLRMYSTDLSTVPNISERPRTLRTCVVNFLEDLVFAIGPESLTDCLSTSYLRNLTVMH